MVDPSGEDSDTTLDVEQELAAARKRRSELRAELDQVERTIQDLERRSKAGLESSSNAPETASRTASAWDRALQTRRRNPVQPEPTRPAPVALAPPPPAQASRREEAATPAAVRSPPAAPQRAASPVGAGPSFLSALEVDERLAPNQREALRLLYVQFVPGSRPDTAESSLIPADEALDKDPALGRGQRETIRVILSRFLRKTAR